MAAQASLLLSALCCIARRSWCLRRAAVRCQVGGMVLLRIESRRYPQFGRVFCAEVEAMDVIAFIKTYQLDAMLIMSGICATLAYLALITAGLSARRRRILCLLELTAVTLLICDRFAYIFRGDVSQLGFWMVRICNFMVYFCSLVMPLAITFYLDDLYTNEGKMQQAPKRLRACIAIGLAGLVLLVVSQFTGLYYTFDAQNHYQRAPGNIICYIAPMVMAALQLSAIVQYRELISRTVTNALVLNLIVPIIASVIQLFTYGISLTNMTSVGMAIVLYGCALRDLGDTLERARKNEIETYKTAQRKQRTLFEQTAAAMVSAIDAKDEYTRGHSARVAVYSELIAAEAGMSEEECEKVYFAALLHDVGKIGIADSIIKKDGRLTDEEFAQIKLHPVYGNQILSSIDDSPYLSVGAHYHHERYDGRGYPEGLAGEDIPLIARIIGVADAYDAMTSKRSYRDLRPQHLVRHELLKGMGSQFDPRFARIMLHYIDLDLEYRLHETLDGLHTDLVEGLNTDLETQVRCDKLFHDCSTGVRIIDKAAHLSFECHRDAGFTAQEAQLSLILFDSLDGLVHEEGSLRKDRRYFEYAQIRFDGSATCAEARKVETSFTEGHAPAAEQEADDLTRYEIEAVRYHDHVMVRVSDPARTMQAIVALPFSGRFSYLSLAGEHCTITNMQLTRDDEAIDASYIPRIAEEVSYINGCPQGDIPNIQITGARARSTVGIPVSGKMRIAFHAQSLPNARLIWHCPYLLLFTSKDGTVGGQGYEEYVLVRLDGEELEENAHTMNAGVTSKTADFKGWDEWMAALKQGVESEAIVTRDDEVVSISTENLGIAIRSIKLLPDEVENVYLAFTGDQCTVTNIRVTRE